MGINTQTSSKTLFDKFFRQTRDSEESAAPVAAVSQPEPAPKAVHEEEEEEEEDEEEEIPELSQSQKEVGLVFLRFVFWL